jgi:hypothetical protein
VGLGGGDLGSALQRCHPVPEAWIVAMHPPTP